METAKSTERSRSQRFWVAVGHLGELMSSGGLSTLDREREEMANEPVALSPELIQERTGYTLNQIFTDFAQSGRISPDLHEERERLSAAVGEDNVLTSMYVDDKGEVQLGLFVRESQS